MSKFFPTSQNLDICSAVDSLQYVCGQTQIIISSIPPGAVIEKHKHPESQAGLAIGGEFEIEIDGQKKLLRAFKNGYSVPPNTFHSAKNLSSEPAIGLDIKRVATHKKDDDIFIDITEEKELKTGLSFSFLAGSWFEIMVAKIPFEGIMHPHKHKHEQIGIGISGKYLMSVEQEEKIFGKGNVYFAPSNSVHSAYNPYPEEACSINVFMPPRYNKAARSEQKKLALAVT